MQNAKSESYIDHFGFECLANGTMVSQIVEQQLTERAQAPTPWPHCSVSAQLNSKGFVKRRILTLVGWEEATSR